MSHTKEVQLSWQPAARREQKQRERYRAAVEKGDRLLPWQREVVKVVEKADQPVVVVSIPRAKDSDRYKVINFIGVTVCNSIPHGTYRGPARLRPSVPWSP